MIDTRHPVRVERGERAQRAGDEVAPGVEVADGRRVPVVVGEVGAGRERRRYRRQVQVRKDTASDQAADGKTERRVVDDAAAVDLAHQLVRCRGARLAVLAHSPVAFLLGCSGATRP